MPRIARYFLAFALALFAVASTAAERVTYFVTNALGSPIAAMDAQGDLVWRESYAPYGERLTKSSGNDGQVSYTGKPEDVDTGFVYMGARWHDPETARFLGLDPVAFRIANVQSFNRYYYGNNSPFVFIDPDGREEVDIARRAEDLADRNRQFRGGGFGSSVQGELNDAGGIAATEGAAMLLGGAAGKALGKFASRSRKYGPTDQGPLSSDVANTFRSGTYTQTTLNSDTILYRVISENGKEAGRYWTRDKPSGPLQSVIDFALDQNWGNSAERVVTARVPSGTTIYEGVAAAQRGLVGGGNQVYIPKFDPGWIQ